MKLNSQVDTQLSAEDCFYISDRYNKLLPYPIHCHADYELNFTEHGAGARRIVGDSMETLGDYDLVLITGQDLEHVWERYQCTSTDVREITIHFSSDLFDGAFTRKTHFRSILSMLERARCGLSFSADIVAKVRPMLYELAAATPGFYAVVRFMVILYELSQDHQAKHNR